jgi:rhodanese-related sulfurtransferase
VSGRRASAAATLLEDAGFKKVRLLEGNYPGWEAAQ